MIFYNQTTNLLNFTLEQDFGIVTTQSREPNFLLLYIYLGTNKLADVIFTNVDLQDAQLIDPKTIQSAVVHMKTLKEVEKELTE